MSRLLILALALATAACTIPTYEAEPTSPIQWQRRQEAIERREAERRRLCETPSAASDAGRQACDTRPGDK